MPQALDKFLESLRASGLPLAAEIDAFLQDNPSKPKDGEQLARLLVREKKLTAYQAQELYAGRGKKLVFGNYVILDKLGQGGMGMVLKAEHRRMERLVALKVLSAAALNSPDAVKRFQREVKAAAKLTHANIVTAHDADEANGQHFLVMEYVEGSDLSQLVKKSGPLPVDKALHCILQAARGLEFAHTKGVVHRDIKPSNLLIDADGTVKILDMGLARIESAGAEQAELTGTGQIMGTVDYMAPEQAVNTRTADHRADIYALAYTLWFLLTGRAAYDGETVMEKLMAHQQAEIPSLSAVNANVPPALENVFRRMAAKKPAERYQSMTEALADLERCRSGKDVSPTISLGPGDDSKFSQFLKGFGGTVNKSSSGTSPSPAPIAAPPVISTATDAVGNEQTIVTPQAQSDTDPETNQHLPKVAAPLASGTAAKPTTNAPPWLTDWRVLLGASLAGVLLLGLVIWTLVGGGNGDVVVDKPVPPAKPLPPVSPQQVPSSYVNYALDFDGSSITVDIPNLVLDEKQPTTVECFVRGRTWEGGRVFFLSTGSFPVTLIASGEHRGFMANCWSSEANRGKGLVHRLSEEALSAVHHVAVVWDDQKLHLYVDGVLAKGIVATGAKPFPGQRIFLGAPSVGSDVPRQPIFFDGTLDEIRVSKTARYRNTFQPPAPDQRFTTDDDTLALYHCDEGSGTVLRDSSGRNHHGTIAGATWKSDLPPVATAGLRFDGQSYVSIPTLSRDEDGPYTLEAWIELSPRGLQSEQQIASIRGKYHVQLGKTSARNWAGSFFGGPNRAFQATTGTPAVADKLIHVAYVTIPQATQTQTYLFVDGRRVASMPQAKQQPVPPGFTGTLLGGYPDPAKGGKLDYAFHGVLHELRVSSIARYQDNFEPERNWRPGAGTIALYRCDKIQGDTLTDLSSNNHHGQIIRTGPAPSVPDPAASLAHGLDFDGTSSYVAIPTLRFDAAQPYTLEAWIEPTPTIVQDQLRHIFSMCGTQTIALELMNGKLGSGRRAGEKWDYWLGGNQILKSRRTHVASVWDGKSIRLFLDGKPQTTQSGQSLLNHDPLDMTLIGAFADKPGRKFFYSGRIGGLRVSKSARYLQAFEPEAIFAKDDQTLALYRFDEGQGQVLNDSSGNNHHGTIVNAKWAPAAGDPDRPNFALAFDGQDDYVDIPSLIYDGTSPFTLEAWVTPAEVRVGHVITLHAPDRTLSIYQDGDSWHGVATTNQQNVHSAADKAVQAGRPQHVAFVWDGRVPRVFVNGLAVDDIRNTSGGSFSRKGATLGGLRPDGLPDGSRIHFRGQIDEVRVSKIARYGKDFPPPGPGDRFIADADTVALYHFDEGTGDVLNDSSGHNRHGKIFGAKWAPATYLYFNGKDAHVSIPDLNYDGDPPITIEAWARAKTNRESHVVHAAGKNSLSLTLTAGVWQFWQYANGTYSFCGANERSQFHRWHHVAATYDGKSLRLFVDGQPQEAAMTKIGAPPPPNFSYIGGAPPRLIGNEDRFFDGDIGPVRVSRGVRYKAAFTPQLRLVRDADTIALYRCDEGQGTVLHDSSGGKHDGTIVGATWVVPSASTDAFGDAAAMGPWRPIFDGKTLAGWKQNNVPATWSVDKGELASAEGKAHNRLEYEAEEFGDFDLRCECQYTPFCNSGIYFHAPAKSTRGWEVEIGAGIVTGSIYNLAGATSKPAGDKTDEWVQLEISVRGATCVTRVNGQEVTRAMLTAGTYPPPGRLALQGGLHPVRFRKLEVRTPKADISSAIPAATFPTGPGYALQFAPERSGIHFPTLKIGIGKPATWEAWYAPQSLTVENNFLYTNRGFNIRGDNGEWRFGFWNADASMTVLVGEPMQLNRAAHVAGVWDGTELRLYVNGKLQQRKTPTALPAPEPVALSTGWQSSGLLDEIRISDVARYTAPFDPPRRHEPDDHTVALYHFDEGAGDEVKDSSGQAHHGRGRDLSWVKIPAPSPPEPGLRSNLADAEWSAPENLGPIVNTTGRELSPSLTDDEKVMVYVSGNKLMLARRESRDKPFDKVFPVNREINVLPGLQESASISGDGLLLVVGAEGEGGEDVWLAERATQGVPFGSPVRLPEPVNSAGIERSPVLSTDGLTLLVTSNRIGRISGSDIWQFTRKSRAEPFGSPLNLGREVNAQGFNVPDWISPNGLTLLATEMTTPPYVTKVYARKTTSEHFGPGFPLKPPFDKISPAHAWVSPDGERIYFHSRDVAGGQGDLDLWMCRRVNKEK